MSASHKWRFAHEAPVIHPVIHFQAIPDTINRFSGADVSFFIPVQTARFREMARICNALPVHVFSRCLCLFWWFISNTSQWDGLHRCAKVCLITSIHVRNMLRQWRVKYWEAEFRLNTFWFESRQQSCRSPAQSKPHWNSLLGGVCCYQQFLMVNMLGCAPVWTD